MSLAEVKEKLGYNKQTNSVSNIEADFINEDVPTNETVDSVKLKKIYDANLFHIGASRRENEDTVELVSEVYKKVRFGEVPRDLDQAGFAGFDVTSKDFEDTGFQTLNFDEHSGFRVEKQNSDSLTFNVRQNTFNKVVAGTKELVPENADTLHFKGSEGVSVEASVKNNANTLTIRNRFSSIKNLKDVDAPDPKENDILVRQGDKFRAVPLDTLSEIAPSVIYGGEF